MKHKPKVILIILAMFIITQFIGLYVVNFYLSEGTILPYGIESPDVNTEFDYYSLLFQVIFAFIIAMFILFLLIRYDLSLLIRIWFFLVVVFALGISFNSFLFRFENFAIYIATLIALPLAYLKMYKRDMFSHNITEFFIYPGIAAVFVGILNIWTAIALLIIISIYDMWAVWHSGIMQKMAKYQIDKIKVFSGFFIPYLTDKQKQQIKKAKESKSKKAKDKKINVNVAILGGGDVIFPIITAGVFLNYSGIISAMGVIFGALAGLSYLFLKSEKKKFYPAMPYITAGIFLGLAISFLITKLFF